MDLCLYKRCLLEDFWDLKPKSWVYVLIPKEHHITKDDGLDQCGFLQFNKKKIEVYTFLVHSNAKLKDFQSGITKMDIKHGMNEGNYGVTFLYTSTDGIRKFTQLITWSEVLDGGTDGLQVWDKRNKFRNLSEYFRNRNSSDANLQRFINIMYK